MKNQNKNKAKPAVVPRLRFRASRNHTLLTPLRCQIHVQLPLPLQDVFVAGLEISNFISPFPLSAGQLQKLFFAFGTRSFETQTALLDEEQRQDVTQAFPRGTGFFLVIFRFVSTAAFMMFLAAMVQHAIWFRTRIIGHVIESVAYAAITGLIFAALWPAS